MTDQDERTQLRFQGWPLRCLRRVSSRFTRAALVLVVVSVSATAVADQMYRLPADIDDFSDSPEKLESMKRHWNWNMNAFALQGITGNPWANLNDAPRNNYVNFAKTDPDPNTAIQPITWSAFPNRVRWYFDTSFGNPYKVSSQLVYPLADDGRLLRDDPVLEKWLEIAGLRKQFEALLAREVNGAPIKIDSSDLSNFTPLEVPSQICPVIDWTSDRKGWGAFGPQGPRGWKDEYNEWVVFRNEDHEITKIVFTAENPEYWFTLWRVDPDRVLELYRELVSPNVVMSDLVLKDADGKELKDSLGQPAYNPLNKWNYGNRAVFDRTDPSKPVHVSGGAAHLTSPPNTVGAEIYLGAAATILRNYEEGGKPTTGPIEMDRYSPVSTICAAQYGSNFRNSDPNIGFQGNQALRNVRHPITLTDPVALYMQYPDFSNFTTPDGTPASEFFTIVRGRLGKDANPPVDYDQILHAVFEVPQEKGYTVSDIKIGCQAADLVTGTNDTRNKCLPIWWGSQFAESFNQALAATIYLDKPRVDERSYPAVASRTEDVNPWPQPMVSNAVFQAVQNEPRISAATIPVLPPAARPGDTLSSMALEVIDGLEMNKVTIEFTRPGSDVAEPAIKVRKLSEYSVGVGTVPGKHKEYQTRVYVLDVEVGASVEPGQYGLRVVNHHDPDGPDSPNAAARVRSTPPVPAALLITQ